MIKKIKITIDVELFEENCALATIVCKEDEEFGENNKNAFTISPARNCKEIIKRIALVI